MNGSKQISIRRTTTGKYPLMNGLYAPSFTVAIHSSPGMRATLSTLAQAWMRVSGIDHSRIPKDKKMFAMNSLVAPISLSIGAFFHFKSLGSGAIQTSIGSLLYVRGTDVDTVTGVSVLNVTKPVDDMDGHVILSTTTSVLFLTSSRPAAKKSTPPRHSIALSH